MTDMQIYIDMTNETMSEVEKIINAYAGMFKSNQATHIGNFLVKHGLFATPENSPGTFEIRSWLNPSLHTTSPTSKKDGIVLIHSNEGDIYQRYHEEEKKFYQPGQMLWRDQIISLHDCNWFTPMERATTLLHEARHARQRLCAAFEETLIPLDTEEEHEWRTWVFTLDLVNSIQNPNIEEAIALETEYIKRKDEKSKTPGITFYASNEYHKPLTSLYGAVKHRGVRTHRTMTISIEANRRYWPTVQPVSGDDVVASIVRYMY